eukprot:tig00000180_g13616.t1
MPVFVRQLQVGRHVRSGVRDVVVGVAGVALCFRGAGNRSERREQAPEPGKEVREDTRRVQACASSEAPVRPGRASRPFQVSRGGKSGGFASSVASIRHRTWRLARPERVCTCPSHSSTGAPDTSTSSTVPGIVQSARRPAGRAGALRADVVVVPVAAALSRYDIKAARSWGGRPFAGSELTVAIAAAVGSVGLVVGLFWDGDPVLQPALRRY